MQRKIVLLAQTTTIVLLTMPLAGCDPTDILEVFTLLNPFGGQAGTTVLVCPNYPATPPEVVDTLQREAEANPLFRAWVIDQSQLKDNLSNC